jgi:hypothetical protein
LLDDWPGIVIAFRWTGAALPGDHGFLFDGARDTLVDLRDRPATRSRGTTLGGTRKWVFVDHAVAGAA